MNIKNLFGRKYILASKSERRIKLLKQIGLNFISIDSEFEELESKYHNPVVLVKHNSQNKSRKVAEKFNNEIIIGADTIVLLGNKVLNKPVNLSQAKKFLTELSGKKHIVYTGINIIDKMNNKELFDYVKTSVTFRNLSSEEINYYVNYHKPLDKAGAYGIQDDFGCLFIKKISGDYYNVVGLPLVKLYEMLKKLY